MTDKSTKPAPAAGDERAEFEAELRRQCFQRPTTEAHDLAWSMWQARAARSQSQEQERKPLTDAELEDAYRDIWRNKSASFGHTTSDWITEGIRYAERKHGITAPGGEDGK